MALASKLFLLLFGAILLAVFIRALADFLALKTTIGPQLALAAVLLVLLALAVLSGILLAPRITGQFETLLDRLPSVFEQIRSFIEQLPGGRRLWRELKELVSMIAVGVATWAGLALIGVPASALLGVVAGALTFVPYAGPIAASVPIALAALLEGTAVLVYAMIHYTAVQMVEGFFITPLVQERVVTLPSPVDHKPAKFREDTIDELSR